MVSCIQYIWLGTLRTSFLDAAVFRAYSGCNQDKFSSPSSYWIGFKNSRLSRNKAPVRKNRSSIRTACISRKLTLVSFAPRLLTIRACHGTSLRSALSLTRVFLLAVVGFSPTRLAMQGLFGYCTDSPSDPGTVQYVSLSLSLSRILHLGILGSLPRPSDRMDMQYAPQPSWPAEPCTLFTMGAHCVLSETLALLHDRK